MAAEPPGGGRQDHDVMREAAMRTVTGGASTDTLAAAGGLDVPGKESHPELARHAPGPEHGGDAPSPHVEVAPTTPSPQSHTAPAPVPHEPIPGERDPSTMTHREPGAVGGQFAGADVPSASGPLMDERTAYERAREGGGDAAGKQHR